MLHNVKKECDEAMLLSLGESAAKVNSLWLEMLECKCNVKATCVSM
jgi:hypothetical protein